ncbi:MAG: hypothetical protein MUE57_05455 [Syntrophales bacterium]|jgi:hypothetical protein|nr:hypothetical protein [Syntrophales bacterium]
MKRKLLITAGVIAAALILAVALVVTRLDSIVTKAINTYGPGMTGTEVRIDDVRVSFLSGEATVTNFVLGNPKGYRSAHAAKAASISVDLDIGSLLQDTIVVKRIEVVQPDIIYEKRGGTDNFKTIARHAEQKAKEAGMAGGETGNETPGKKLLIREFILKGGRVTLYTPDLPSGAASAAIPDMHLRNVGGDGAEPSAVFSRILAALYDRLTMPIVVDSLNRSLLEARKTAEKGTRSLTDRIKGIFR